MIPLIIFLIWLVGPSILDFLGFYYKKDMDVMENYCELQMLRRYDKSNR